MKDFPRVWEAMLVDGTRTRLDIVEPIVASSHCQNRWVLRTDFSPISKDSSEVPVGLGLSSKQTVRSMIEVTDDPLEQRIVLAAIDELFASMEDSETKKSASVGQNIWGDRLAYLGHPLSAEERASVQMSVEAIYRSSSLFNGGNLYHVRASKKYTKPTGFPDTQCWALSDFQGWALRNGELKWSWLEKSLVLSDCDGKETTLNFPLGILPLQDSTFVVVYKHYYESESYAILEVGPDSIWTVIDTPGGGC